MTPTTSASRRTSSGPPWIGATPAALAAFLALALAPPAAAAPPPSAVAGPSTVRVVAGQDGARLTVDGKAFMVLGMNWDYFPIGTNYNYAFWNQPDDVIEAALANEMPLMRRMGVNTLRLYTGVPRRWVQYLHDRHGMWTVLNHTVGRYGYTLDGTWIQFVDYSDPRFRSAVKAELAALVEEYKGTPGLLMWLLGNESNYGLSWSSFEIEALPQGEREVAKARFLYSLFGEIIRDTKARDPNHLVAIANGDLQYIDLIAQECQGLDVLGANVYRGRSMGDVYDVVKAKLGLPVMFTEFGADAFDARAGREDDLTQARYLLAQWQEIYEQSAGKGKAGNAVGGLIFQWSDGWWKYRQELNLDVHDTNASWPNGGYKEDYVEGDNNMNEEWWGLCAKGPPDARGLYPLYPRTAYYALQQAFRLDPYGPATTPAAIAAHFGAIAPEELTYHYKADKAAGAAATLGMVRLTDVRLSFETYSTGGNSRWQRLDLVDRDPFTGDVTDRSRGFDHMESFYATLQVQPSERLTGKVEVNVLGNVAQNPIDEIFYENRGKPYYLYTGPVDGSGNFTAERRKSLNPERVKIYKASVTWDEPFFRLDGFFRAGHYHWGDEGDVFGLYQEANDPGIDTYGVDAPLGFEVTGKRALEDFKLAFGPQLWWGANPTLMGKYRHRVGPVTFTLLHQEDVAQAPTTQTGGKVTVPPKATRKTVLAAETRWGPATFELAGIRGGSSKVGDLFLDDRGAIQPIVETDTLGARAKVLVERGPFHWYAQGGYMGLVADAGPDARKTFTGWTLKDSGSGNQVNALTGLAINLGQFQVAPNFLWQKPLVGPGASILSLPDRGRSRNVRDDPFAVRANRETQAAELMLVWDPTPATWMWAWDNDLREDAPLAASLDVAFRHMPTTLDATFWTSAEGDVFPFERGVPAADVWEVTARVVSAPTPSLRLVAHLFGGTPQANGQDARQPNRYGGDLRVTWHNLSLQGHAKFNDYGPYDYYRDFNLTMPLQLMGDLSYALGPARWLWLQQSRLGVRATSRWLNGYSGARYKQDPADPKAWGQEYEIRTYLVVTM